MEEAQKPKRGPTAGYKVPVKYRGPNGEEWSGRGRLAGWLQKLIEQGRSKEEFKVTEGN